MKYTVISKSAWTTAMWKIQKTFTGKEEALRFVSNNQSPDLQSDFYKMAVKGHRKTLSAITNWDNDTVTFGDGTEALCQ